MEEYMVPIRRTGSLQARRKEHPIIDVTYVELPDRVTHRINASSILGGASLVSMVLAPAAVEGGSYMLAVALVAVCGICARLAIREEEGKRRD